VGVARGDALKGPKTQRVREARIERNLDFLFYSRLYSDRDAKMNPERRVRSQEKRRDGL
jgi:hypothetical protein